MIDYKKLYEETFEKLQNIIYNHKKQGHIIVPIEDIENGFPELKESGDKESKKWILEYLYDGLRKSDEQFKDQFKSAIAWLEKQGEQKPTDKVKPKFKIGDFLVNDYCMGKVIELTNDAYLLDTGQGIPFSCEHNVHLWTIEDAQDGDILITNKKQPFIFNGHYDEDTDYIYAYCGISDLVKDDSFYCEKEGIEEEFNVWCTNENVCPATKEQCDLLFTKMHEAGYEWNAEKKELKEIHIIDEGKAEMDYCFTKMMKGENVTPAWSEEDNKKIKFLVNLVNEWCDKTPNATSMIKEEMSDWIKSLKDRYTWKPSDEQIMAIRLARSFVTDDFDDTPTLSEILIGLEEQLQKLKEE